MQGDHGHNVGGTKGVMWLMHWMPHLAFGGRQLPQPAAAEDAERERQAGAEVQPS